MDNLPTEDISSKFELVLEGHEVLRSEIRENEWRRNWAVSG